MGDKQETLTERCEIQMPYILYVYKQIVIQSETNNQIAKQTPYPELRLAVWLWTYKKITKNVINKTRCPLHRTSTAACTPTRSRRP